MALENPPLNGKIMKNVHLFLELFPNYVVLLLSIPAKEPPCAGEGGHFSHLWNCWTLSAPPTSISCIYFSEWDPPPSLSWDLNFGCRQQKGKIAIHKIQRFPSRANHHLIILKREPRAYAGPTVSTFFQYRRSPPIIISSKLDFFCYKRFCPKRDP